ncbi:MAG: FAD-dependent oxidoreductase [Clostridia bacterium]|nr:FAD-dependent oxidoreductase [Clostridia bacterium]
MEGMKAKYAYDVAVCGGGIAGISAALAAAREGKKVILFEKQYILGGLGTAGLVTIYLPLCDGLGHQVSFGIAEELLKLSVKYGAEARYPENWLDGKGERTKKDKRYEVQYNAQVFAILAEQLLLENGVDILYGSYVVGVQLEKKRIALLYVENKSGRTAYTVRSVVDATGDCDIAWFSNAPTNTFNQGNVLAAWYYYANENGHHLQMLGASDVPDNEKTGKEAKPLINRRFTGLEGKELSEMTCLSHRATLEHWLRKRENDPSAVISTIATIPQVRMTRKLVGEYTLSHNEEHVFFEDSIGMVSNWKKRGPVYEIPFRTLYSKAVENLIVAGRCTSVDETLWDVMRVIPCCAVTGQAAGTAAAMTDNFWALDIAELQRKLTESGVVLHEKDLGGENVVCLERQTVHEMKLNPIPFSMIKRGEKTIELRLFDEKRQCIKVGDIINFTNTSSGEKLSATVKKLHRFHTFEELYQTLPLMQCGYTAENIGTAHHADMEQYYSPEEQRKYGVVGIELCVKSV